MYGVYITRWSYCNELRLYFVLTLFTCWVHFRSQFVVFWCHRLETVVLIYIFLANVKVVLKFVLNNENELLRLWHCLLGGVGAKCSFFTNSRKLTKMLQSLPPLSHIYFLHLPSSDLIMHQEAGIPALGQFFFFFSFFHALGKAQVSALHHLHWHWYFSWINVAQSTFTCYGVHRCLSFL